MFPNTTCIPAHIILVLAYYPYAHIFSEDGIQSCACVAVKMYLNLWDWQVARGI